MTCSVEWCGAPRYAKGLCSKHYQRLRTHGDPLAGGNYLARSGEPLKFYRDVVLSYEGDDCLDWPYAKTRKGYGNVLRDGRNGYVHRLVCEDVNGPAPTEEHQAAHSCGNRICVNPKHIRWATASQNHQDKIGHGTYQFGERNPSAKLTEAQAREIIALKGKETRSALASRYGVKPVTIWEVQTGRSWAFLSSGKATSR